MKRESRFDATKTLHKSGVRGLVWDSKVASLASLPGEYLHMYLVVG